MGLVAANICRREEERGRGWGREGQGRKVRERKRDPVEGKYKFPFTRSMPRGTAAAQGIWQVGRVTNSRKNVVAPGQQEAGCAAQATHPQEGETRKHLVGARMEIG